MVYPNMSYDQNVGATAQLLANSMAYVAGHAMTVQPEWLSVDPVAGVLEPGTSGDVNVMLDATTLLGGTYQHDLKLFSNDLSNPELIVPVSLEVTELYDVTFKLDLRYQDVSENGVHLLEALEILSMIMQFSMIIRNGIRKELICLMKTVMASMR